MFVSSDYLGIHYGVDDKIARFFADREPPADNLYWHNKLLYLRPAAGYLFIPLMVDLLYRAGLDRSQLLSEEFVGIMERVGHISALEETKQITQDEAIDKCIELVSDSCKNKDWFNQLVSYFKHDDNSFGKFIKPFKALHRGDVFLFSLCALEFDDALHNTIVELWFALISTLLLIDDAEDLEGDTLTGEENAFLEAGASDNVMEQINELAENNIDIISKYSRSMAAQLEKEYKEAVAQPHILQLIKQL